MRCTIRRNQPPNASGTRKLVDLLHRLDEHVLSQFFGFVGVADSAHRQRNDAGSVSLKQLAECVSVARLVQREPIPQPFVSR